MAIGLLAGIGLVAAIVLMRREQNAVMSRISAATGGSHRGAKGSGSLGPTRFDYKYKPGGRYGPPEVIVSVPVVSGARFQVKNNVTSDQFLHMIGLSEVRGTSKRVQSGEAAFDGRFFLACDSADTGRRIFSSPGNRETVRRIFERDCRFLAHDGTCVFACVRIPKWADQFNPTVVTRIVPHLAELAAAIRQSALPGARG
jgi:hypothetical protein